MITTKNWMTLVAGVIEKLPTSARAQVSVYPDVLDANRCPTCSGRDFFVAAEGIDCAGCHRDNPNFGTSVNLNEPRPRVGFYAGGSRLASAVLVRHEECVDLIIPEAPNARFRVNSRSQQNSPSAVADRLVELVVSRFGARP